MPHRSPRSVLALAALLAAALLGPPPERADALVVVPEVFVDVGFLDAKLRADQEGKIALVVATRADCEECPEMMREVFENPRVVAWLEENAVCYHFDAEEEPGEALRFEPGPFPTIIVIREGHEIDRITEPISPNRFLNFVRHAAEGRGRAERVEKEWRAALRQGIERNAQVRYEWANKLLEAGAYEAATEEFLFLWNNMLELNPLAERTRRTFMADKIKGLCFKHPPALEAFTAIRDELTPRVAPDREDTIDPEELRDWIVLNSTLRQFDRNVEWAEAVVERGDRERLELGGEYLFESLIFRFRWDLAGLVYRDPMEFIELRSERWGDRLGTHPVIDSYHLENYGEMYGALLAAGRIQEAIDVANAALDFKDEAITRRRLVDKAELAGVDESLRRVWEVEGPMPVPE